MDSKGKNPTVLWDEKWKYVLVFLADIITHLSVLNLQLQGRESIITDMCNAVKAFQVRLHIWETQMHQCNLSYFPCCQVMLNQVSAMVFPNAHFADHLSAFRTEHGALMTLKHRKVISSCFATHLTNCTCTDADRADRAAV